MEENTNKAIIINTIILYIRLAIVTICGLLTTRFALKALGAENYGLFSVVGGVISFMALFNTIMLSTSNRFIATAIGKKDECLINETFNVNLLIHFGIAIITAIIAFPLGDWYIINHVNFNGDLELAVNIYNITIIGSIISFIGVPYHGLMLAKERFLIFSIIDIVSHLLKLCGALLIVYYFSNKLLIYTLLITSLTALPTAIYIIYCSQNKNFKAYSKIKIVHNKSMYKEVLNYSIWIGYGAMASIGKNQGSGLIINKFFDTLMNTSLGIANSISHVIQNFAYNIGKSITPQITKSYASGNVHRSEDLAISCSKYTFLLLLLMSSPFLVETEFIINLWLGDVPPYSVLFTRLLIIDSLIISLNNGIPELIFASGKIKWYQLIVNTILLLSVICAFFVLKTGKPAYYLQITYIIFSIIILIVRQFILNIVVKINNWRIIKESYIPCFFVTLLFLVYTLINTNFNPIINIIIIVLYISILIITIGLKRSERQYIYSRINKMFCNKRI